MAAAPLIARRRLAAHPPGKAPASERRAPREQLKRPAHHDAPARGRGTAGRDGAALGRVAKSRFVKRALQEAVQVGVHADTLPPTAGGRIGDITGNP
jgi:hypothetical protein